MHNRFVVVVFIISYLFLSHDIKTSDFRHKWYPQNISGHVTDILVSFIKYLVNLSHLKNFSEIMQKNVFLF